MTGWAWVELGHAAGVWVVTVGPILGGVWWLDRVIVP